MARSSASGPKRLHPVKTVREPALPRSDLVLHKEHHGVVAVQREMQLLAICG
jgi:hypothetical protein